MFLIAFLTAASTLARANHYCSYTRQHTLCHPPTVGPSCGGGLYAAGVSEADIEVILRWHNHLRGHLAAGSEWRGLRGSQPPAADMMALEWDEELALLAQMHAQKCVFQHDCPDCRKLDRFGVGQNLYMSRHYFFTPSSEWERAMSVWYNEVQLYDAQEVQNYRFKPEIGHYSQMVWASTSKIGCGFVAFQSQLVNKLYVCNYGPTGNVLGATVYTIGLPCSQCHECSVQYPGLCEKRTRTPPPFLTDYRFGNTYQEALDSSLSERQNYHLQSSSGSSIGDWLWQEIFNHLF